MKLYDSTFRLLLNEIYLNGSDSRINSFARMKRFDRKEHHLDKYVGSFEYNIHLRPSSMIDYKVKKKEPNNG